MDLGPYLGGKDNDVENDDSLEDDDGANLHEIAEVLDIGPLRINQLHNHLPQLLRVRQLPVDDHLDDHTHDQPMNHVDDQPKDHVGDQIHDHMGDQSMDQVDDL